MLTSDKEELCMSKPRSLWINYIHFVKHCRTKTLCLGNLKAEGKSNTVNAISGVLVFQHASQSSYYFFFMFRLFTSLIAGAIIFHPWGSILLGPSAKHMALKEPTNHQIFHQNPRWRKIFHCIRKPCHAAWSSTLIVPGFPFAWRAECIKGNDLEASRKKKKERSTTSYIGSVFGTGTHLDSFDSCPVPFQCIREASSQKAHGPEIDPQFSSNCDAANMPWVLLPSCHWMSLWCLQKADRELEGCNHLRQASSQEVLPQNSQFFEDVITACSHRWLNVLPHQHTL